MYNNKPFFITFIIGLVFVLSSCSVSSFIPIKVKSEKYGYEFILPKGWVSNEAEAKNQGIEGIYLFHGSRSITVTVFPKNDYFTFERNYQFERSLASGDEFINEESGYVQTGNRYVKITRQLDKDSDFVVVIQTVLIDTKGYTLVINMSGYPENLQLQEKEFNAIIASIKILE